jgi:outer membrane protein assembly factor BamB
VLAGAAIIPSRASSAPSKPCAGSSCRTSGRVRWTARLPGSWVAQPGLTGTVTRQDSPYAAESSQVAAVGFGTTVLAYSAGSGTPLWQDELTGFPAGSSIVSIRAWSGVVTAGVDVPGGKPGRSVRREVVLAAGTGVRRDTYPAALYGGAVSADARHTVVVGSRSVTSYDNATGKPLWRQGTGSAEQAWRVDGSELYVTESTDGYLGSAPVTALRRINLETGNERVVSPPGQAFAGQLSLATDGVVVFAGPTGLTGYVGSTGQLLWHRTGVLPEFVDVEPPTLYVASGASGASLVGIDPVSGGDTTKQAAPGSAGLYAVRGGIALGLDQGALGDAWGYSFATRRVVWTSERLPWPHFFVDLSGLGGSADPSSDTVLLAACARVGTAASATAAPPCARPELVALNR